MAEQAPVAQVAPDGDVSATDGGSVFFVFLVVKEFELKC